MQLLRTAGIAFGHFDVLTDEGVREGMKSRYDWPTFPMVFVEGVLVGGVAAVATLLASGQLQRFGQHGV